MKNNLKLMLLAATVVVTSFTACKKDEPLPDVNEEELITTLTLRFTNSTDPADVRTFTSRDLDGDGGNPPQNDPVTLAANTTYDMEVTQLLNDTENPPEDILAEVEEESADHLFVYKPVGGSLSITVTDKDVNNLPIGIKALGVTGAASTGTLMITLRHQPDVKDGTEAPGATDTERLFNYTIQ